ncbi:MULTISPECIES: oxygen-independent coproporphyrinogen III oxidase [unclassified Novosphingobium]|uniref:oxygen-independent coproporphyrinogen III oxidase n=1 Tax=unclassified Novosphingobium TaxID=2644732 RepID=UPI000EE2016D|nr:MULTISPECIES: oxygen-independent coproporphyrinogen III oxidase [unclassified Novosphingobium]HCF24095.1 oxygen-independent coproporphyrinogen III oxidase [Novosphingobium sp.]HQV03827.1 oxygen-independent coproporphyrinogen III oxidase [Novosphingobium sp.]
MWTYYPDLLETPVPRYTSFPTAAEFGPGVSAADYAAALETSRGEVSLYLHVPFCEQICWYCGCNTGKANKTQRLASYLDALHREIAITGVRLDREVRVRRIAFGGGSPNAISPTDFVRLIDALTLHMPLDRPVWSIELDPRTLTREWGQVLGVVGVTHASLGVQTFDPALQAAIGRIQPDAEIASAVDLLRGNGISSLNFDLMYGLPGQSLAMLEATLQRTVELGADRIALFGYAHVPHMLPRQRRIDASALPGQAERFAMAEFGLGLLTAAGYVPIGFDHFARPQDPMARALQAGTLRRNFQGFTDDPARSLIGMGASAIGCFPDLLVQNEKNAGRYRMLLSQDVLPATHGIRRSADDQRRGAVIEALLCFGRAELDPDLAAEAALRLAPFAKRGLARMQGSTLSIAPAGLPYARTIAALFDPYRQDSLRRFSSAV